MAEEINLDSIIQLEQERMRLVEWSKEYQPLLSQTDTTPDQIQDAIEELRAIRMRIHEIDRRLKELQAKDH
jgi:hypothetical protein